MDYKNLIKIVTSHTNKQIGFSHGLKDFEQKNGEVAVGFDVVSSDSNVPVKEIVYYSHSLLLSDASLEEQTVQAPS